MHRLSGVPYIGPETAYRVPDMTAGMWFELLWLAAGGVAILGLVRPASSYRRALADT